MLIDRIHTIVQNQLQKHDRGYITPDEYNSALDTVQNKIRRGAFDEILRYKNRLKRGLVDRDIYDKIKQLKSTVDVWYKKGTLAYDTDHFNYPIDFSFVDFVEYNNRQLSEVGARELRDILNLPMLDGSTDDYPVYVAHTDEIEVIPDTITSGVTIWYYKDSSVPIWAYTVVSGEKVFDESSSTDLDLPEHMIDDIVRETLIYLGIEIKDYNLVNSFSQQDASQENLKNIN